MVLVLYCIGVTFAVVVLWGLLREAWEENGRLHGELLRVQGGREGCGGCGACARAGAGVSAGRGAGW